MKKFGFGENMSTESEKVNGVRRKKVNTKTRDEVEGSSTERHIPNSAIGTITAFRSPNHSNICPSRLW